MFSCRYGARSPTTLSGTGNLLEILRVHDDIVFAVLVEIVVGALLDEGLFQRVGRLVALVDLVPSLMRRISSWVTGVPLPGWMFSAVRTT